MSDSPISQLGASEDLAFKAASAYAGHAVPMSLTPPTTAATASASTVPSKKRRLEPKAPTAAEKKVKKKTDDFTTITTTTTSDESLQVTNNNRVSKPIRPRKTPEEKAAAAREAKRLFQIKFATRKLDRTRYKGYMKNMNDAIHPVAFRTMDYETLLAIRTHYFDSLREKVLKCIKNLNKRGEAVCQSFTEKNLWRYCFCFSSVFFGRGLIWRYNNHDVPLVESFGDFLPFMKHMGVDELSNKPDKAVTEFAQLVDNSVPLKRMMEPVLVQYGLLLRTFLRDSEAAGKKVEDEEEASEEAADTVAEEGVTTEGQMVQQEIMPEQEIAAEVKNIQVETTQVVETTHVAATQVEAVAEEQVATIAQEAIAVEKETVDANINEQEESTMAKPETI